MSAKPSPVSGGALEARALWFSGPRVAEFRWERVRPAAPGEVRVGTISSAISQGTEMLVYRGEVPIDLPLDLPTLAGSFSFPIKYGYATVGRVSEVGAGVAIEVSGSGAALQAAIDAVATEGTVVVASWYGTKPVTLALGGRFHRGRVRLRSSQVGRINPELGSRWDRTRRIRTVLGLLPR